MGLFINTHGVDPNFVFFDSPSQVMSDKSYKVTRVLNDSCVIAKGKGDWHHDDGFYPGLEVLILDHKASTYYNEQIIKVSDGKQFKQVGIYKTGGVIKRAIPIVTMMN